MSQEDRRYFGDGVEHVTGDDGSGDLFHAGGDFGNPETLDEAMGGFFILNN